MSIRDLIIPDNVLICKENNGIGIPLREFKGGQSSGTSAALISSVITLINRVISSPRGYILRPKINLGIGISWKVHAHMQPLSQLRGPVIKNWGDESTRSLVLKDHEGIDTAFVDAGARTGTPKLIND